MIASDEAYFRTCFEQAFDGMAIVDANGALTRCNSAFVALCGRSAADLAAMNWTSLVHPEDRGALLAALGRLQAGEIAHFEIENRYLRKDGSDAWTRTRVSKAPGSPTHAVVVVGDLTETRRAAAAARYAQELKTLFIDEAPFALTMVDRDMRYVAYSRRWLEESNLVGREVLGLSHYEVFPEISEEWKAIHRRALLGETVRADEDKLAGTGGEAQWLRWEVRPWRDAIGEIGGIVISSQDITARKRAEEELARAGRLQALARLAGGVAHDFNNLLTVIAGNLELCERRVRDEPIRRLLRRALAAAEVGASVTRRLTSMTHRRALEPQRLNLAERITGTLKLIERALGKHHKLVTEFADGLWPTFADSGEVDSALMNLAFNARDAMPRGGRIVVAMENVALSAAREVAHPDARPGDYVRLSVTDAGTGMPPETLQRAMEPLFTTKGPGKGAGLGLSSVARFAKQSGGFVTIESREGEGTCVGLYLPRAVEAPRRSEGLRPHDEAPRGDGELILAVDDDDDVREVTLRRLESLGYVVAEARSGAEAIALLQSEQPIRLVLCDIAMPGDMNGYDVARWAASAKPNVQVVLSSAYHERRSVERERGGLDGVVRLDKPHTRLQLARMLRRLLAGD